MGLLLLIVLLDETALTKRTWAPVSKIDIHDGKDEIPIAVSIVLCSTSEYSWAILYYWEGPTVSVMTVVFRWTTILLRPFHLNAFRRLARTSSSFLAFCLKSPHGVPCTSSTPSVHRKKKLQCNIGKSVEQFVHCLRSSQCEQTESCSSLSWLQPEQFWRQSLQDVALQHEKNVMEAPLFIVTNIAKSRVAVTKSQRAVVLASERCSQERNDMA